MRKNPTEAEAILWDAIRSKALGCRVRRQVIMLGWIVDFYIPAAHLIIEVDGGYHERQNRKDKRREVAIRHRVGARMIRFTNEQVTGDLRGVVAQIKFEVDREVQGAGV